MRWERHDAGGGVCKPKQPSGVSQDQVADEMNRFTSVTLLLTHTQEDTHQSFIAKEALLPVTTEEIFKKDLFSDKLIYFNLNFHCWLLVLKVPQFCSLPGRPSPVKTEQMINSLSLTWVPLHISVMAYLL